VEGFITLSAELTKLRHFYSWPFISCDVINKKLSLRRQTRATRLEVSQCYQIWYHSIG